MHWDVAGAETLAHEIGHVLGHSTPYMNADHVWYDWEGFATNNLMHTKSEGVIRDKLTTGQIFRMNVIRTPGISTTRPLSKNTPRRRAHSQLMMTPRARV